MAVQVQLSLDAENLEKWSGRIKSEAPEVFDQLLAQSGDLIADAMRMKAPVRTGFLRGSIIIRKRAETVEVGSTAPYAGHVEAGAKPHIILPVHASALAFEVAGQKVFAKHVRHPGFQGRFFAKAAKDECLPKIRELVLNLYCQLFYGEV